MLIARKKSALRILSISFAGAGVLLIAIALPGRNAPGHRAAPADPWTAAQTVQPAAFAAELKQEKDPAPTVIYVGVHTLYNGAHIQEGSSRSTEPHSNSSARSLRIASGPQSLPRRSQGREKCPNIRPAFSALQQMGFTRLRVLILPASFAKDWVEKGYPIEKSSAAQP